MIIIQDLWEGGVIDLWKVANLFVIVGVHLLTSCQCSLLCYLVRIFLN